MLELRPDCDAMICSYECTFCVECVETVLRRVSPRP